MLAFGVSGLLPVPMLVVCPDLPTLIHQYDDLHNLSPCTHVPSPLLDTSPCLLPSSKVIASIWGHLVLGSCHPPGLADCFSLFTCLFSFSVFCGFFLSFCVFVSLALLMPCLLRYSRSLERCKLHRDGKCWSLRGFSRIPAWHKVWLCRLWAFLRQNPTIRTRKSRACSLKLSCFRSGATEPDGILSTIISYLTIFVNIIMKNNVILTLLDKLSKLTHNSYVYERCFYCFRLSEINKAEHT
jgi:hypothetical protein